PNHEAAMASLLTLNAAGALTKTSTVPLISVEEGVGAMQKRQDTKTCDTAPGWSGGINSAFRLSRPATGSREAAAFTQSPVGRLPPCLGTGAQCLFQVGRAAVLFQQIGKCFIGKLLKVLHAVPCQHGESLKHLRLEGDQLAPGRPFPGLGPMSRS